MKHSKITDFRLNDFNIKTTGAKERKSPLWNYPPIKTIKTADKHKCLRYNTHIERGYPMETESTRMFKKVKEEFLVIKKIFSFMISVYIIYQSFIRFDLFYQLYVQPIMNSIEMTF